LKIAIFEVQTIEEKYGNSIINQYPAVFMAVDFREWNPGAPRHHPQ
jgi:hypothetical protein